MAAIACAAAAIAGGDNAFGGGAKYSPNRDFPYVLGEPRTAGGAAHCLPIVDEGRGAYLFPTKGGGTVKITPYDARTIRVQWHWREPQPKDDSALALGIGDYPAMPREVGEGEGYFWVRTPEVEVRISKGARLRIDFHDRRTGKAVCKDDKIEYNPTYDAREDSTYDDLRFHSSPPLSFKVKNTKIAGETEGFFGLGDWAGPLDRRGHHIQFWNEDAIGWEERKTPKYTSFPVVYSVTPDPGGKAEIYAIFFNNTSRTAFDMCKTLPDRYSFEAGDGQLDYFFFLGKGEDFMDIADSLTRLTGRTAFLPKWAYGYNMSKFSYTESEAIDVLRRFYEIRCPLSGLYIDLDYMDQSDDQADRDWNIHQLTWNKFFPNPKRMIQSLAENGVETVVMIEPFLDRRDPLFDEAERNGFFIRDINGKTQITDLWCSPEVAWIDFTNPEARDWWRKKVSDFSSRYGFKGIWNDLNETADVGRIRIDGIYHLAGKYPDRYDSRRWHGNIKNIHSLYSCQVSYSALEEAWPEQRPFVLSRGGFPGIQRWAAGWSGDNVANAAHLANNIRAGISIAICGFSNYGHDIGGYTGSAPTPILQRWHEWAVFCPFMRSHYGRGCARREPFVFAPETRDVLVETIRQRYYFLPQIYSIAKRTSENGSPLNAPVVAYFPNDRGTFSLNETDFMLGDSLLVAPVVTVGAAARKVSLPSGSGVWHSFWDDVPFAGGTEHTVHAPGGWAPLFAREGAVVFVNPSALLDRNSPAIDDIKFRELEIHVWGGRNSTFRFFDDNGISPGTITDRQRMSLTVGVKSTGKRTSVSLSAEGGVDGRKFKLVIRGVEGGKTKVSVSGSDGAVVGTGGASAGRSDAPVVSLGTPVPGSMITVDISPEEKP